MLKNKFLAAALMAVLAPAAFAANTGAAANAPEATYLHPIARSQSTLTRDQVRADMTAGQRASMATSIWTAADGGNPAHIPGSEFRASGTSVLGAAPAAASYAQPTAPSAPAIHRVFTGNAD